MLNFINYKLTLMAKVGSHLSHESFEELLNLLQSF